MRSLFIILLGVIYSGVAQTQTLNDRLIAQTSTPLEEVEQLLLPPLDNDALLQAELNRRGPQVAPRFAEAVEVDIKPTRYGLWDYLPDGNAVWRLRIHSPEAFSLNLGFTEYYMPPGGSMILYGPNQEEVMGPFSPADNEAHQQLWTPVFPGDMLVIEVQLPIEEVENLRLWLTSINHDFMDFLSLSSGDCNLDVVCGAVNGYPIVDLYRDIIQSVAVYGQGGDTFCTGVLVNNTSQDCTPYFLTAFHCDINQYNAPSVVAYWNYQNSYCRPPGSPASGSAGDGDLSNFNTGTIWRASHQPSDFTLLEFDDPIPTSANTYLAGWSSLLNPPTDTLLCIHHPNGEEKRMTISYEDSHIGVWGGGNSEVPSGNHVIVPSWSIGSTESGSSGAPLFNRHKQIVGQLHGGAASCDNNNYDAFGWIRASWAGGGTPQSRLRDWLDPAGNNAMTLNGRWMNSCNIAVDFSIITNAVCSPGTALFTVEPNEYFQGFVELNTQGLPDDAIVTFTPNPVVPGNSSILSIALPEGIAAGNLSFEVIAEDAYNDVTIPVSIDVATDNPVALTINSPEDAAIGTVLNPLISWQALDNILQYELQLATDPLFINILVQESSLQENSYQLPPLPSYTHYYYRVRAYNVCGVGTWSPTRSFTTAAVDCNTREANNLPKVINGYANEYVTSSIYISTEGTVGQIALTGLDIEHTFVGDLSAFLESPSGTVITLFDRPGVPISTLGCSNDNIRVSFSDDAPLSYYAFETSCSDDIAISGHYRPVEHLSALIGEPVNGEWKLIVLDHANEDGGQINAWNLDICNTYPHTAEVFFDPVKACTNQVDTIELFIGYGFQEPVALYTYSYPSGLEITFEHAIAQPGTFNKMYLSGSPGAGQYNFILSALNNSEEHICSVPLDIIDAPLPPLLVSPENDSPLFENEQAFDWIPVPGADSYTFILARDYSLTQVVHQAQLTNDYYLLDGELDGGNYYWTVYANNYCGGTQSETFFFIKEGDITNEQSIAEQTPLQVFPNPASETLNILYENSAPSHLIVYATNGAIVHEQMLQKQTSIDVRNWPAGLYILKIIEEGKVYSQWVVIGK
jgi:subtilisin-like proprotein convertase family protein